LTYQSTLMSFSERHLIEICTFYYAATVSISPGIRGLWGLGIETLQFSQIGREL
jgi:hypothetical protein